MSKPKVHYFIYDVSPSEADQDGNGSTICGLEEAEHTTEYRNATTCKKCINALAAPQGEVK